MGRMEKNRKEPSGDGEKGGVVMKGASKEAAGGEIEKEDVNSSLLVKFLFVFPLVVFFFSFFFFFLFFFLTHFPSPYLLCLSLVLPVPSFLPSPPLPSPFILPDSPPPPDIGLTVRWVY